jgi:hypothetical protein
MSKQKSPTGIAVEPAPPLPTPPTPPAPPTSQAPQRTDAAGNRSATHDIGLRVVGR